MITIRIADMEQQLKTADEHWINQQINRRRANSQSVCVRVTIRENGVNMALSTPTCPSSGAGGRPPNPIERKILDLWQERDLNKPTFTGGNVVAFLHQLKCVLG